MNEFKNSNFNKYVKDFLLELEELSSSEILMQLELFKKIVEKEGIFIYPFYKTLVEDGKTTVIPKKIEEKDAVELLYSIIGRIKSYIIKEAYRIIDEPKYDACEFCDFLEYLKKQATEEEKELALEKFDDTFSYLEKVPIFQNFYHNLRQSYFSLLKKKIEYLLPARKMKDAQIQENIKYRVYSQKAKNGFLKRRYFE